MTSGRGRRGTRTTPLGLVAALAGAFVSSCAEDALSPSAPPSPSQDASADPPLRELLKGAGLAADVAEPPDFVVKSRPAQPPESIPPFTTPSEPPGKIQTAKELEATGADLEAASKRHDALRAAYPPAAEAAAEAAAKKANSENKAPQTDAAPPL